MEDESLIEDEIQFIKCVQETKILYDQSASRGLNSEKRMAIIAKEWDKIARTLDMPSKDFAAKKWRYFRDKFVREYRVFKLNNDSFPENYCKWILYNHMKFLEPHVRGKRNRKSFKYEVTSPSTTNYVGKLEFIDSENTMNENGIKQDYVENEIIYENYDDDEDNFKYEKSNNLIDIDENLKDFKILQQFDQEVTNEDSQNPTYIDKIETKRKRILIEENKYDPDATFTTYVLAEMRHMSKRRRNQLKALIVNFILNDDEVESSDM